MRNKGAIILAIILVLCIAAGAVLYMHMQNGYLVQLAVAEQENSRNASTIESLTS